MRALFSGCCCAEPRDNDQIVFYSTTEEGSASGTLIGLDNAAPAGSKTAIGRLESSDPPTSRSLTPEEREAEKARLSLLVNTFALEAVKGCACKYVDEKTGACVQTTYRIDKGFENLIIVNPSARKAEEDSHVTCPIASIQDIYTHEEDGRSAFPKEVMAALNDQDQDLLMMIVYHGVDDRLFRFCMLETSKKNRDVFLECLRILSIYAQSAQGQGKKPA